MTDGGERSEFGAVELTLYRQARFFQPSEHV